ncbi:MAG: hypothetical protein AAB217_17620 [Chloroflexota bacterium]
MNTKTFSSELLSALAGTNLFQHVSLSAEGPIADGRAYISEDKFLNFYFNEETGTLAFALIDREKRAWGIDRDNLRGWHLHPSDNPDSHVTIEPMTISEIIARLSDVLSNSL